MARAIVVLPTPGGPTKSIALFFGIPFFQSSNHLRIFCRCVSLPSKWLSEPGRCLSVQSEAFAINSRLVEGYSTLTRNQLLCYQNYKLLILTRVCSPVSLSLTVTVLSLTDW